MPSYAPSALSRGQPKLLYRSTTRRLRFLKTIQARFAPAGIGGMVAVAIGITGLAAMTYPGVNTAGRRTIVTSSAVSVLVGAIILAGSRIPLPEPALPVVAPVAPVAIASPDVVAHHNRMIGHHTHATPVMLNATPEPMPGPGTTLSGEGVSVTIAAAPESAGPVTVEI